MSRRHAVLVAVGLLLSLVVASCNDDDGSIDVGPSSLPASSSTTPASPASPTTTSVETTFVPGSYLEESRPSADEVTLTLRTPDGAAVREVATAPTFAYGDDPAASPFIDGELAPDGTIYVVERSDPSLYVAGRPGGTRLMTVAPDGAVNIVRENVTGSELSPDGTRMAIVVMSPDGDGDGSGTQAIRVIDLATGAVEELWSTDVALDDTGVISVEIGRIDVVGWTADQSSVIVQESCCDSGAVMLMPSSGRSDTPETLPAVRGDHATYALGTDDDGRILVQRTVFEGDGVTVAAEYAGIEVVALDSDGAVSDPVFTEPATEEVEGRVRFDLIGDRVPGTVLPIAAQGDPLLFGAGDERTARRFA